MPKTIKNTNRFANKDKAQDTIAKRRSKFFKQFVSTRDEIKRTRVKKYSRITWLGRSINIIKEATSNQVAAILIGLNNPAPVSNKTPQKSFSKKKNPFAEKDGSPIKGMEHDFFKWEENKWEEFINNLPEEEKQQHLAAAKSLAEKMDH